MTIQYDMPSENTVSSLPIKSAYGENKYQEKTTFNRRVESQKVDPHISVTNQNKTQAAHLH